MNYSELPSVAVLVADFPSPNLAAGADKLMPAAGELARLAALAASQGEGGVVKTLGDSLIVKYPDPLGAIKGAPRPFGRGIDPPLRAAVPGSGPG